MTFDKSKYSHNRYIEAIKSAKKRIVGESLSNGPVREQGVSFGEFVIASIDRNDEERDNELKTILKKSV